MPFVIEHASGALEEIRGAFQSGEGDDAVYHPAGWLDASTAEDRAALQVHEVTLVEVPAGMLLLSSRFEKVDGVVTQIVELEPEPIVVPGSVTPRQLRLALLGAGKLGQVEAFVASGNAPPEAVISWEYATEFLRSDPMLNQLAAVLQPPLGEEEIDRLFIAAAQIQ